MIHASIIFDIMYQGQYYEGFHSEINFLTGIILFYIIYLMELS
jgi:hypothetical protein